MKEQYALLHTPQFVVGRGSLSFFSTLGKKRIGIIKGGKSYNEEVQQTIESLAKKTDAEICYLAQVRNEPYIDDIFNCMEKVRAFEPDMILAIGGGSVLDTAKAIHLFYENPELSFEEALIPFTLPRLGKRAVHISIPTTSGTGSETTSVAVFIDPITQTKKLIMDNTIIPHYAILDANLTDTLPDSIRVATGMDALTHAIEASVAQNASAMTKSIAIEAAMDILENLPKTIDTSCTEKEQLIAREKVHIASAMAGVAITNSCTGIVHSYDHPGPAFGIAHGVVCGLMLPYTISLCGVQDAYITLAKRLGYSGSEEELVLQLKAHLIGLIKQLQMKSSFKELGIDQELYYEQSKTWALQSLDAFATVVSPAEMTVEKGLELYRMCYEG
ncbi:iron-containing alcohol dehydrogenase [Lachnospiraceae bacterium LCP25S3_G4]